MEEIVALRKANPGGGPHSLTGSIYVNGAEPGDVMEIRILKKTVPLRRYEAYSLASMVADCRVSQVVDVRKGVHCMVPKSTFAQK
jgi:acetamidase/formamidase